MNTEYLRDAVCIGFIVNEGLSIAENAGLMGIPLPAVIKKSIDILCADGAGKTTVVASGSETSGGK